jgi:hypothetical protein
MECSRGSGGSGYTSWGITCIRHLAAGAAYPVSEPGRVLLISQTCLIASACSYANDQVAQHIMCSHIDFATSLARHLLHRSSIGLCRGLFEIFLGSASVVPEARKAWAAGARSLLESEEVNRASRKGGSG